jgi:galactose mutarotase-like enzyme
MTRLRAGALEATLQAGEVLAFTSLRHHGEELLVGPGELPPEYLVHRRWAGIPLMHPWANRLGGDMFALAGVAVTLRSDDPAISRDGNGLAIHGLRAGEAAWKVRAQGTRGDALLVHAGAPAGPFPFPHTVAVGVELRADRLSVTTAVHATGNVHVPVAFGWHPYLRLPGVERPAWRLALPDRRHQVLDGRGIPSGESIAEAAGEEPLATHTFDDGYDGIAPGSRLAVTGGGRRIAIHLAEGYPAAQVFAPAAPGVVAPEPMTAPTNALVSGRGLRLVPPGGVFRATFHLEVDTVRACEADGPEPLSSTARVDRASCRA